MIIYDTIFIRHSCLDRAIEDFETQDDPYTYAEFRGVVERIEEDPEGAFYNTLAKHYGVPWGYRGDPRVILYMKIQHIAGQNL